jgi:protocatechuate 3,4-dioxygenase beta subunit
VVDGDGKPVPNARIYLGPWHLATSAEDGAFAARNIPEDATHLTALAGSAIGSSALRSGVATIAVAAGRTITGVVRDDAGKPLRGMPVIASSSSEDGARLWASGVTDEKGRYRIDGLPAAEYGVYVGAPPVIEFEPAESDLRRAMSAQKDFAGKPGQFVRGVVLDEEGKPVAGAAVTWLLKQTPLLYTTTDHQMGFARTGPDGRFRIEGDMDGALRLVAFKRGYAAGLTPEQEVAAMRARPVTITLPRGFAVSGVVVDSDGKPVAAAEVTAMTAAAAFNAVPLGSALATKAIAPWLVTKDDGTFVINLNAGAHDFAAWKEGFAASEMVSLDVKRGAGPLRLTLQPSAEIRGRITRKSGKPPEDGTVSALRDDSRGGGQGRIEPDGTFVITSLSPGTYMLMVESGSGTVNQIVEAPASDLVIELPSLSRVSGRVIDAESQAPVTDFNVTASGRGVPFYDAERVSDAAGRFAIEAPVGEVEIGVRAEGYVTASKSVTVSETASAELEIVLTRGRKFHGRVVNSKGEAVAEVDVSSDDDDVSIFGQTDDSGAFEIEGAPRSEVALSFRKNGYVGVKRTVAAGDADAALDVVLDSGRKVSGRVVDAAGNGVGEASVWVSSEAHGSDDQSVTTAADGTFTVEGLLPVHYDFSARKDGAGEVTLHDVDISQGHPLLLRLDSQAVGKIRGTVTGAGTDWMTGMVQAVSADGYAHGTVSRDGSFVIENVPVGEVTVAARFMSAHREASTGAKTLQIAPGAEAEVTLSADGGVSVEGVVSANGQPINGASVSFDGRTSRSASRWRSTSDQQGRYAVRGLEPGSYSITVESFGRGEFQIERALTSSTTLDIDVSLRRLEGEVAETSGAVVPNATVTAVPENSERYGGRQTATSGSDGRFTLSLQPGITYRVTGSKSGYAAATRVVDGNSTAPLRIELLPSEGATVRVVDARSGVTLSGYVVVRENEHDAVIPVQREETSDGAMRLPLPPGQYRVSVSANRYASQTVRVNIPGPETRIALTPGGTVVINAPAGAGRKVRFVLPNGEEYVRCYCNGIAEIRLEGAATRVENVAPGSYRMEVLAASGEVEVAYPVVVIEGQTTTVDVAE